MTCSKSVARPLPPSLFEGSFAENGTRLAHHAFLRGGARVVEVVVGSTDLPQHSIRRAEQERGTLCPTPKGLHRRQRWKGVCRVGPVLGLPGQFEPLLEHAGRFLEVAPGRRRLGQIVERDVAKRWVLQSAGRRQRLLERPLGCSASPRASGVIPAKAYNADAI